jgi:serine/threonine protein phosphatase PrpC
MSDDKKTLPIESSALSDRGLNERRPLNEDSFLADGERRIFAVADGVGGAEAGEVASQTAIEVLDEAFRHHDEGADIEDLMELAIQRANSSIHQMAQEHQKFSMMATTIVALHLNGTTATIGHVGDSRLYRLTPDGQLIRETEDHSIVEEEVRAGRMTPEQAANHPSKNVISRALGAEEGVEVDMKTLEVEEGTEFLLCTDGITRHVSDNELRQLLVLNDDLETICGELKQRCYERGAEDNLTVVIVRVGEHISVDQRMGDLEPTVTPETQLVFAANPESQQTITTPPNTLVPASRIAFPGLAEGAQPPATSQQTLNGADPKTASRGGGGGKVFLFLFALALLAGAFYAGARYKEKVPFLASAKPVEQTTAPSVPPEEPFLKFERSRREVDRDPRAWLENEKTKSSQGGGASDPLNSTDPEFLYLYGRANLLSGNSDLATRAFESAIDKVDANPSPAGETIKKEATLGLAAVSLKTLNEREKALKHYDELTKPSSNTNSR